MAYNFVPYDPSAGGSSTPTPAAPITGPQAPSLSVNAPGTPKLATPKPKTNWLENELPNIGQFAGQAIGGLLAGGATATAEAGADVATGGAGAVAAPAEIAGAAAASKAGGTAGGGIGRTTGQWLQNILEGKQWDAKTGSAAVSGTASSAAGEYVVGPILNKYMFPAIGAVAEKLGLPGVKAAVDWVAGAGAKAASKDVSPDAIKMAVDKTFNSPDDAIAGKEIRNWAVNNLQQLQDWKITNNHDDGRAWIADMDKKGLWGKFGNMLSNLNDSLDNQTDNIRSILTKAAKEKGGISANQIAVDLEGNADDNGHLDTESTKELKNAKTDLGRVTVNKSETVVPTEEKGPIEARRQAASPDEYDQLQKLKAQRDALKTGSDNTQTIKIKGQKEPVTINFNSGNTASPEKQALDTQITQLERNITAKLPTQDVSTTDTKQVIPHDEAWEYAKKLQSTGNKLVQSGSNPDTGSPTDLDKVNKGKTLIDTAKSIFSRLDKEIGGDESGKTVSELRSDMQTETRAKQFAKAFGQKLSEISDKAEMPKTSKGQGFKDYLIRRGMFGAMSGNPLDAMIAAGGLLSNAASGTASKVSGLISKAAVGTIPRVMGTAATKEISHLLAPSAHSGNTSSTSLNVPNANSLRMTIDSISNQTAYLDALGKANPNNPAIQAEIANIQKLQSSVSQPGESLITSINALNTLKQQYDSSNIATSGSVAGFPLAGEARRVTDYQGVKNYNSLVTSLLAKNPDLKAFATLIPRVTDDPQTAAQKWNQIAQALDTQAQSISSLDTAGN